MKILTAINKNWVVATEVHKLAVRVWHRVEEEKIKSLMVSSALQGEGKSTTTAYLGASMALNPERRVLVVDCDFRRPRMSEFLEVEKGPGVSEYLTGVESLAGCIHKTEISNLEVMPAGTAEGNPAHLLSSPRVIDLMARLKERYDVILVDSPALGPVADSSILITAIDAILIIVMAGVTTRFHLEKARELCVGMGTPILGVVVGNAQLAAPEYYRDYYHYYGRNGGKTDEPARSPQ